MHRTDVKELDKGIDTCPVHNLKLAKIGGVKGQKREFDYYLCSACASTIYKIKL